MAVLGVLILWYSYSQCTTIRIRNLILACVHVTSGYCTQTSPYICRYNTFYIAYCIRLHGQIKVHTKLWLCQRHCLSTSQGLYQILITSGQHNDVYVKLCSKVCCHYATNQATVFIQMDATPRLVAALELTPRLTVSKGKQTPHLIILSGGVAMNQCAHVRQRLHARVRMINVYCTEEANVRCSV